MVSLKKAYQSLDKPPGVYFAKVQLPLISMGIFFIFYFYFIIPDIIDQMQFFVRLLIMTMPAYLIFTAILLPLIEADKKKRKIDNFMNLFITRMGALSAAELPRKKLVEILSEIKEYGLLTTEIRRIFILISYWSMSLPEAARIVASRTPSVMLSDFLSRLSHAVDTGEDFGSFIRKEQGVVMEEFEVNYRGSLKSLDLIKEMFVSLISSSMFMLMLLVLLPAFTGATDQLPILLGMVLLFASMEAAVTFYLKAQLPMDDIWHNMEIKHETVVKNNKKFLPLSIILIFVIFIIQLIYPVLPIQIAVAVCFLPLLIPGYKVKAYESLIKRCDLSFDAFIRSLGASAEAMGGTIDEALKRLRVHDFGPLTKHIDRLYKRTATRINKLKGWVYFASESGSNLISKFSEMYIKGTSMGGNPRIISDVISRNFGRMVGLRKHRYQDSANLIGILYGLAGAIALVLYLTIGILNMMNSMFTDLDLGTEIELPISPVGTDIYIINWIVIMMLVIHSYFSSVMLQCAEGSHRYVQAWHFPRILMVGAIVGYITEIAVSSMLEI